MRAPGTLPGRGIAAALLAAAAAAHGQGAQVETNEPRAFGYQIGDLVERRVVVTLAAGWSLDPDSLPRPGGRGQALELRRVEQHVEGARHELRLQYQVFVAPTAVRTYEIAPWRLRVQGPARSEDLRVEAWPVTVAPLVPADVSPRRGLGDLQPDLAPPLVETRSYTRRLAASAVAAAVLALLLAGVYLGPPWLARRGRPFGLAWRALRRLPADAGDAQWRDACRALHEALNRSAGEVVFEPGIDRFVARQPAFRGLRDDLVRFLRLSREEFFGRGGRGPEDARWLVALGRRCRDAERGLA